MASTRILESESFVLIPSIFSDYHMSKPTNVPATSSSDSDSQSNNTNNHQKKQNEKKIESENEKEKQIQERLESQAMLKMKKENENLILMTQNYQRFFENACECSTIAVPSKILNNAKTNWMSSEKLNELRRRAHEAVKLHKVFIVKGYFHTVRKSLCDRGWVRRFTGGF